MSLAFKARIRTPGASLAAPGSWCCKGHLVRREELVLATSMLAGELRILGKRDGAPVDLVRSAMSPTRLWGRRDEKE